MYYLQSLLLTEYFFLTINAIITYSFFLFLLNECVSILNNDCFSCQALVKRSVTLGGARGGSGGTEETPPAPSIRRRPSSPNPPALLAPPRRPVLAHNIQGNKISTK